MAIKEMVIELLTLSDMAQIVEIVLFYSDFSKKCKPCVQMIVANRLPIKKVPLDTLESRHKALNGKDIQIKGVPSLVVNYNDGTVQMFSGQSKIMGWLRNMFSQPQYSSQQQTQQQKIESESSEESEPEPRSRHKKKSRKRKPRQPDSIVELIMEPGDPPSRPPPPPTSGLKTNMRRTKESNSDLMNVAKQMAKERDDALGNR